MTASLTPIRAGSKTIPHKNIRILNGKPLFHHVVSEALKVPSIDEVWVSTESEHYGSMVPPGTLVHKRPKELAEDDVPTAPVIMDFLKSHPYISTLVLLEATSPTTRAKDIVESLRLSASGKGCVSVQPSSVNLYKRDEPIWMCKTVRQNVDTFAVDGGIFVIHTEDFLKTSTFPTLPCVTMVMPHPVCDIDTERDFEYAEMLLSQMSTAFIDIDETYVKLQGYNFKEQWSTPTLCTKEKQLRSFILDKIKALDEEEIYIITGGVITEEEDHYIVSDASEMIPFLKGTTFPKLMDGKVIKMRHNGDSAVTRLVRKNKIQEKNILLLMFGTSIESGLYNNGKLVKYSKVGKLLEPEFSTNLATSDPYKLVRELDNIKMILALDDVYVSGDVLKNKNYMEVLAEKGIKLVNAYLNVCSNMQMPA